MTYTSIASDLHLPNQDDSAVSKWFASISKNKPDKIIINGDLMDFWEISSFDKVPRSEKSFKEEVKLARLFFIRLRETAPQARIIFILGNHEFRLKKYLLTVAPEFYDLEELTIRHLFRLRESDVEFVDCKDGASRFVDTYTKDQGFYVGHYNLSRTSSGATCKALVEKYGVNIIQGHCHRGGVYYKRLITGQILTGIEGYCLCNLKPNYMSSPNWESGFVEVIDGEPILHHIK